MMQSVGLESPFNINSSTMSKRKTKAEVDKSISIESTSTASEKKSTSSLPDEVVEKIQEMAKKDASNSVYMDKEFLAYNKQYMEGHISPDRSSLISLMTPMVMSAKYTNGLPSLFQLIGLPFTGMLQVGARNGASMSIYDSSETEILSYDCRNGWLSHPSKEENKYQRETTAIYHEAYAVARTDMKAGSTQNSEVVANSGFDMRA